MNKNQWVLGLIVLTLAGCKGADEGPEALTQSTDNIHFHNAKFGLTIEKPEGWYAQSVEETMQLSQRGAQTLSGDDKNLKAALEASLESTLPLFGFFEFPPGTPGKPNPNVGGVAENVAAYPGVKNGCDYLASMRQVVEQSQVNMKFGDGCQEEEISGSTFGYITSSISVGDNLIRQRYWACRKGDHALGIVQTYHTDEQDAATTKIVRSIKVQCDS